MQGPSLEANWFAVSQEIPRISRNQKVHYRTHSVRQMSLSWASPIQSLYPHSTSWRSILILSTHLRLGLPSGLLPSLTNNIYLLTPWCRVLLEKLTGLELVKKFPAFHGTREFITALTSVRHLSLSWAKPIQSIYPHPTSWRSILILSTHLRLGLQINYLLTPWCRVLLEKLTGLQLFEKFPAFHGTRKFITALTSVRHLSLSWAAQCKINLQAIKSIFNSIGKKCVLLYYLNIP